MIETAYEELALRVSEALNATEFLQDLTDLKIDPSAPFTPTGNERTLVTAASLVKLRTGSVRQLLGGPAPRHVVERECRLEMALAGPDRLLRAYRIDSALGRLALLSATFPTLSGKAERLIVGEQTDDELEPNGLAFFLTFTIRVRSGDPLGRTP